MSEPATKMAIGRLVVKLRNHETDIRAAGRGLAAAEPHQVAEWQTKLERAQERAATTRELLHEARGEQP